jgi:hypothetical protein
MTQEVLAKRISIKESSVFPSYQMQLSRAHLYGEIGKAYKNGEDISKNPTVASFIQSLQKKPEWQKVIQQAAIVSQRHRKPLP